MLVLYLSITRSILGIKPYLLLVLAYTHLKKAGGQEGCKGYYLFRYLLTIYKLYAIYIT